MFQKACQIVKEAVYGVKCVTPIGANQINFSVGTGFMIAPGILVTASHVIHLEGNGSKAIQQNIEVIRAPDIGQKTETAQFLAEDIAKDIALLKIINPRTTQSVSLTPNIVSVGTSCGSLGFPLSYLDTQNNIFQLILRFQGAFVSAHNTEQLPSGDLYEYYETDSLMYGGSSGCPQFTVDGSIFGMQNKSRINDPRANPQPILQNRAQRRQQMKQQAKQQVNKPIQQNPTDRYAISLSVPSHQILAFARANNIKI